MNEQIEQIFQEVCNVIGEENVKLLDDYFSEKAVAQYKQAMENNPDEQPKEKNETEKPLEENKNSAQAEMKKEETNEQTEEETEVKTKEEVKNILDSQTVTEKAKNENFFVEIARKKANKKKSRAKTAVENIQTQIKKSNKEKENLEKLRDDLIIKHGSLGGEIIGLQNANNFLSLNMQSGSAGIILSLTRKANVRRINSLDKQMNTIYNKINKIMERLEELEKNINFLQTETLAERQSDLAQAELKAENISLIGKLPNPLAALVINKKSPEAIAELEKYMFMKIDREKLNNLAGYEYDCRISKTDNTILIIKFLRIDKDVFLKVLEEA